MESVPEDPQDNADDLTGTAGAEEQTAEAAPAANSEPLAAAHEDARRADDAGAVSVDAPTDVPQEVCHLSIESTALCALNTAADTDGSRSKANEDNSTASSGRGCASKTSRGESRASDSLTVEAQKSGKLSDRSRCALLRTADPIEVNA